MTLLQRIAREPNAIAGLLAALYGALVAFGVLELTVAQVGACVGVWGALVAALRWLVTPAAEVLVQLRPSDDQPVAGPASMWETGRPVLPQITPLPPEKKD